jgi:hypothetical protein
MTDPVAIAARAAAQRLEPGNSARLDVEVEAALAARGAEDRPQQYIDPVSIGSLIVALASLAWTVYRDLRKQTDSPAPEVVSRTVRLRLREDGQELPDGRVIEVVVDETLRAGSEIEAT